MLRHIDTEFRSDRSPYDPYVPPGSHSVLYRPIDKWGNWKNRYYQARNGEVVRRTVDYRGGYLSMPAVLTAAAIYARKD